MMIGRQTSRKEGKTVAMKVKEHLERQSQSWIGEQLHSTRGKHTAGTKLHLTIGEE